MSVGVQSTLSAHIGLPEPQQHTYKTKIKDNVDKAIEEAHKIRETWSPNPTRGVPKLFGLHPKDFHVVSLPSGGGRNPHHRRFEGQKPTYESSGSRRAFDTSSSQREYQKRMMEDLTDNTKKKNRSHAWDKKIKPMRHEYGEDADDALMGASDNTWPDTEHHLMAPMAHVAAALMHRGWSPEKVHRELTSSKIADHEAKEERVQSYGRGFKEKVSSPELEELHHKLSNHVKVGNAGQSGPVTGSMYMTAFGPQQHPLTHDLPILGALGLGTLTAATLIHRLGADSITNANRSVNSEQMMQRAKNVAMFSGSALGAMMDRVNTTRTKGQSEPYDRMRTMVHSGQKTGAADAAGYSGGRSYALTNVMRPGPEAGTTWEEAGWGSLRPQMGAQLHTPTFEISPLEHSDKEQGLTYNAPSQQQTLDGGVIHRSEPMDIAYRFLKSVFDLGGDDVTTQPEQPLQAPAEVEEQQRLALGIVGSRDFHDLERFDDKMAEWIDEHGMPTHVVSGGAQGADAMAQQWADDNGIPFIVHKPNYRAHGQYDATGMRNKKIVDSSDHILAFPSIHGGGTMNTVQHALAAGKPTHMHYIEHPADTPLKRVNQQEREASTYHDAWLTEPEVERTSSEEEQEVSQPQRRQTGAARGTPRRRDDNVETGEPMDLAYRLLKVMSDAENEMFENDPDAYYTHVTQRDTAERSEREDEHCCANAKQHFREISEGSTFLGGSRSPNEQYMECAEFEDYLRQEIEGMQDMADIPMVAQAISDMKEILEAWKVCDEDLEYGNWADPTFTAGEPMDLAWRLLK
tara:strand:- start:9627 stop:12026 length:2400 start_codon:yes stop_codon:yes gene_type:complete